MLIGNKRRIYQIPVSYLGGASFNVWNNFNKNLSSRFSSDGWDKFESLPNGTQNSYSYSMALVGGGLVSRTIYSEGVSFGSLTKGSGIASDLNGAGNIDASLGLIISLFLDILGYGNLTASMVGSVKMAADMVGDGNITGALSILAEISAQLSGSGNINSGLRGTSSMATDITPFSELSPENLARAVWNSIAAQYNNTGTMGNKLNTASTGGVDINELAEAVRAEMDANSVKLVKIKSSTDLIPATL